MSEEALETSDSVEVTNYQVPIGEYSATPIRFVNLPHIIEEGGLVYVSFFAHAPLPFASETVPDKMVQVVSRLAMPRDTAFMLKQMLDDTLHGRSEERRDDEGTVHSE